MAKRRCMVVGNWKMNGSIESNEQLLESMADDLNGLADVDIAVCPPFPYLGQVRGALSGPTRSRVLFGAQNVSEHEPGAYTGEVAAQMLLDLGCSWVIVGHSERRTLFGETDATVAAKASRALNAGLGVIVCVGESLEEREAGRAEEVVGRQIEAVSDLLKQAEPASIVLAYEPIWAIGTGKTATPELAQEIHGFMRAQLAQLAVASASQIRLLYGGSVKASNAGSLFDQPDIDGGLIGGASLQAQDLINIRRAAALLGECQCFCVPMVFHSFMCSPPCCSMLCFCFCLDM